MRHVMRILAIVFAALVLAALQSTTPPYAMLTGPIRTAGHQSDTVASATFSLAIEDISNARTIEYEHFGKAMKLETSGVWVVIDARLQAFRQTMPIRAATLVGASGRRYRQSERAAGAPDSLPAKTLQPGLPTTGIFIFELPEDETTDMTLVVSEQYDPQLQDEVSVKLDPLVAAPQDQLDLGLNGD